MGSESQGNYEMDELDNYTKYIRKVFKKLKKFTGRDPNVLRFEPAIGPSSKLMAKAIEIIEHSFDTHTYLDDVFEGRTNQIRLEYRLDASDEGSEGADLNALLDMDSSYDY